MDGEGQSMRNIAVLRIRTPIFWLIHREDLLLMPLDPLWPGWAVVNPLAHVPASTRTGGNDSIVAHQFLVPTDYERLTDDLWWVMPRGFALAAPEGYRRRGVAQKRAEDACASLSRIARQYVNNRIVISSGLFFKNIGLDLFLPPKPALGSFGTNPAYILNAIRSKHIAMLANKVSPHPSSPVEDLFLAALDNYRSREFLTCMIHAATSVEVAAAEAITEAMQQAIHANPSDSRFRFRKHRQGHLYDPVFDALKKPTNFRMYLHERPLYVMGRSLMEEKPTLYRDAQALYSTRNNAVHHGGLNEEQGWTITKENALLAVKTAREAIEWFGLASDFPLPDVPEDGIPSVLQLLASMGLAEKEEKAPATGGDDGN